MLDLAISAGALTSIHVSAQGMQKFRIILKMTCANIRDKDSDKTYNHDE